MKQPECGFCYPREHGTHGEVKREWSIDWNMFISVCRKHTFEEKQFEPRAKEVEDEAT